MKRKSALSVFLGGAGWHTVSLLLVCIKQSGLQVAQPGDVEGIIARSPCLRGMRDVHFAKLLEKLLRMVGTLKVRYVTLIFTSRIS